MTTANSSLTPRTEIVFIESNVADYASLIAGLDPSLEVHVLDATGDGIAQMADILAERSGIDAIHLISHGSAGAVQLGTVTLDEETLQSRRAELETIGKSLSEDGDLLLYGCNVAQGQSGIDFIGKLAQATHADVAGSKNATGESSNGGDWILETSVGGIETHSLSADYSGSLSVVNFDFQNEVTADGVPGLSPGDATSASQTVDGNTLTLSANGKVLVCDDQVYYGYNSANLNGNIFAIDGNWDTTSSLTLSLDSGKIFDLTSFNVQDQSGPGLTLRLTTSKGSVTQAVTADGDAQIYAFNDSKLQGVSSVTITKENSGTFLISLDEIKLENITLPNSAPVFTGLNGGSTYTENGSAVVIDNNVTVADTELDALNGSIGNYNGASLTIARNGGANAQDVFGNTGSLGTLTQGQSFTYNGTSVGTVSTNSGGTLVLTFNTNATSTMVDSVLQSITYSNSSEAPPASVTLNWNFSDGSLSTNGSAGVNITSVNDNPIITAGGTTAFTEQTATAIAPAITITDPDGDTGWNGGTLTVQITGNASADDSLRLPTSNPGTGIWVDGIGTNYLYSGATHIGTASASTVTAGSVWTFTFNANATNALVQDVARAVQFGNDSNDPSTVNRTVTFIATDNGGLSNSATQTVQVSPVNDAPVVTNRSDPGLVFSGVNTSYASFPDIDNSVTESFTLETWVKFSSLSDAYAVQFIAGKGAPGSVEQMELHTNGNALRFIPTGGAYIDTGNVLTTNQWIHIAASYDAATDSSHIYINGVEVPVQDNHLAGNPDDALKSTVHPYYLGKRGDGGLPLNGSIAEFRIWNDVRTADEVRNNMNFGLEGDEANLVALWKLDEGSGTALDDATANNFGGTAFNTTWTTRAVSGGLAVNYTEGAVPVSLFSGATVSTVESGQSIIGLTLTVTNVSDTTERLAIDGSTIDLVDDTSGTTVSNGVNYTVNVSGGTATISLSKATGLTEAQTAALINGIAYSNSSEGPTTTNPRVITLTSMQDDGGGSGTATLTLTSTVTVFGANDAPTDIALSASTASTFDAGNYVVGYLSSTDVDTGDTHTYTLVSGDGATDNALFTISGNELRLTAPSGLTAGTYSARIRTTDSGSEFYEEAFTITVTDSLTVTAASDESFDSGTYAAELADGAGLSLREALAFALAGSKTVGFSAVLNGQTIALGSSATVPTATTLDSDGAGLLTISGQSLALDGALTVANGAGDLFTINSALTGAGSSLTKTGAGTLVLSSANTYTGTTTVSGGTLQTNSLGNSSGLNLDGGTLKTHSASLSSGAAIAVGGSGGTFDLSNGSMTFSGVVSGSGALIVDSTHAGNAIRFSGNNTYSGGTTLNNGILDLASTTALGSGALTVNGGKIRSTTSDWTLDNNLILGNTLTMSGSYALTFNGTVDLGGAIRTISNGLNTSDLTLNGAVINGALVVNNQTGGTLVLAGNNSYASTTISAGTLSITGDANLGSGTVALDGSTSKLQVTGAGIIDNAISLNNTSAVIGNTGAVALSGVLSGTGNLNKEGSGTLTLTGANTFTGNTAVNAGVLVVDGGSALSDSGTVSLGSAAVLALQVSETIGSLTGGPSIVALSGNTLTTGGNNSSATFSGNISGTGSLIKIGTGIFTLAGITEYTGATTVSQGTLQLDASGSLASSVTVATGATFDASGTSTTIVTIQTGGHLRINGDSVEDLVTGDLTLASGATFHADLGGATAGSGYDQINVNGAINLTGATLDLSLIGGFTPTIGNSFTLISNDGSDTVVGAFNGLAEGDKFVADGSRFTVSYTGGDGNDFVLTTIAPNTAPAIISNGGGATASINVVENSTAVATVEASDVDAGDTVTYSITGGADQAKFQIDATTGVLTFTTAPDFENPTDTGANNTYEVIVQADDTDGGSDTQTLTVTVTNVNEAPVNNVPSAQVVASNTDLVFSAANANLITISDADIGNNPAQITLTASNGLLTLGAVTGLSFTVGDGTSDATMTFTGTLADINAALDGLTFSPTSGFGGSASLTLDSSDQGFSGSGGSQTDSDTVAIMVNTAPAITSNGGSATASINVAENTTAVTTVQATDADVGQTLTYSLAGGADAAKFAINANTGALSFISAPNYEAPTDVGTDNTYEVIVRASDGTDADEQTLTVTVTDVNETVPPVQPPIQPTPTLIDGVSVQTTQQTSASGLTTTTVQIDPVSTGRVEDSTTPHNTLADIPLVTDATGATLLSTGLPVGIGIQSITQSGNDLTLRQQLINASEPRITDDTAWQQILSDGIDAYTAGVTAPSQVTVRTLVLTAASGSSAPGQPIVITGARGTGENDSAHPLRQEALIIDARTLPAGSVLSLDQVEFAIIIGPVTVTGGTGRNLVLGDGSAQILILGAEDDILHGGAGDDTVGSHGGDDQLYGDAGNDTVVGGEGHDTLDGGDGNDLLHGGQSDAGTWSFTLNAQHQLITTFTATTPNLVQHASETHTGAWSESTSALTGYGGITFADQPVGTLETLSLLCQALLQRFPDVAEMNYWANQGLTPQQLAQLAYHAHLGGQAIATSLTAQSADLIGWLWGDEAATPELTQAVADYIEHGGTWADVVLAGIRHDTFRGPLADADGTLTLTQSHHSGESGWSADIGHDTLSGGAGNDTLIGGRGSDTLDGGDGLDTAVFSGNRSASQFAWDGDILRIATGSDTDQLTGIERLRFADRKIAFDVTPDGNAGQMMAFIATVAPDHLDDLSARGLILGLLDSGETLLGLSQKALDLHLVPDDNADLANTLCQHVLNGQPTAERTQALTSYIEENGPASFIAAVAGLHLNIDLVGLQQSGVEYC